MGKVRYPGVEYNQFGIVGPHDVPLEPGDAMQELARAVVDAVTPRIPVTGQSLSDLLQAAGLPTLDDLLQKAGFPTVDQLIADMGQRVAYALAGQGAVVAKQRIRIGQSCQQYDEIAHLETMLHAPARTITVASRTWHPSRRRWPYARWRGSTTTWTVSTLTMKKPIGARSPPT